MEGPQGRGGGGRSYEQITRLLSLISIIFGHVSAVAVWMIQLTWFKTSQ